MAASPINSTTLQQSSSRLAPLTPKEEWVSLDGKERIVSSTRLTYPRGCLGAPSGIVKFERFNGRGPVHLSCEFRLHELSDYQGVRVEWEAGVPVLYTPESGWPEGADGLTLEY